MGTAHTINDRASNITESSRGSWHSSMDRDGHIASKMAGRGKISAKQIDNAIGQQLSENSLLCTNSARNYTYFAKQKT